MNLTLAACALENDLDVLDVACGPGILACALAGQVRHVTGIDITPAMIEQARQRQAEAGLDNLSWHIGDATMLPFDDEAFDRVTTRYSFYHMPDPGATLAEMKRVCRPHGRIIVIDATPSPSTQQAYDKMERLLDPSHTSALTLEQLRGIGQDAGLREVLVKDYRLEARLEALADIGDLPALTAMFEADIESGQDKIGVGAWHAPDGVHFCFPITIVAWEHLKIHIPGKI